MKPHETASAISYVLEETTQRALGALSHEISMVWYQISSMDDEERNFILKNVRISAIGSSTRIENAVLTDLEVEWIDTTILKDSKPTAFLEQRELILDKLSKDKERSIDEVAGCRAMLNIIYQQAGSLFPLSEVTIRGLHKTLMEFYAPASHYLGKYKVVPNRVIRRNLVSNEESQVLVTSDPGPITEAAMHDLVEWYNATLPFYPWSLAVAVEFVFRFLAIHPFQDGNGRLGRGLFLLSLLHCQDKGISSIAPYLNIDRHIEKNREEYYLVLRQCSGGYFSQNSSDYNYKPLLDFKMKIIHAALKDIQFYRERYGRLIKLNLSSRMILDVFKDQAKYRMNAGEITEYVALPRRTVNDSLNKLVEEKFISRLGVGKGTYYQLNF